MNGSCGWSATSKAEVIVLDSRYLKIVGKTHAANFVSNTILVFVVVNQVPEANKAGFL